MSRDKHIDLEHRNMFCKEIFIKGKVYLRCHDVKTKEPVMMVLDTPEWREILQSYYNCTLPTEEDHLELSPIPLDQNQ